MGLRSTTVLGDANRTAVLRLIGREGPISRAEIARRVGLSPATVTAATRELLGRGLVDVVERAPSRGGRPALLLGVVAAAVQALGVKVAPDHLIGVRTNLDGDVLERFEHPFDATAAPLSTIGELLRPHADPAAAPLLGIGLGAPGVVDPSAGTVVSPLLGWDELAIGEELARALELPVLVDNDVNTLAVAERLFGRGHDVDHFVTVTIGRGVGLGIVLNGDVYRGARGGAGEFGHVPMEPDGPLCECGNRGCLEALVSDPALVAQARVAGLLRTGEGIDRLRGLADAGSAEARDLYARAGATLGRALGGLVNVLGPELVLISGEGTQAWPHLARAFHDGLRTTVFPPLRDLRVEVDPWDDEKWARGAAALVLRAMLQPALGPTETDVLVRERLGRLTQAKAAAR